MSNWEERTASRVARRSYIEHVADNLREAEIRLAEYEARLAGHDRDLLTLQDVIEGQYTDKHFDLPGYAWYFVVLGGYWVLVPEEEIEQYLAVPIG